MYFCIRDDDTSFFTSPEELERAYGQVTHWGPVSLAVIPFCRAGHSKGVPEKFRGRWSVHPLHENQALIEYLRAGAAQGRFEIMLHGYHHDEPTGRGEFAGGQDLEKKVAEGHSYLQDLLGAPVRVFVPPRNILGRAGLRAIIRAGLDLAGTAGVRAGWPLLSPLTWRHWLKLRGWQKTSVAGIPWVLNLGDHREIPGNPVTPSASFTTNNSAFETAVNMDGIFCAATHYWELSVPSRNAGDPSVGEHLRHLIDRARSDARVTWRTVGDTGMIGRSAI